MAKHTATFNGKQIASSDDCVFVDNRWYFPPSAVSWDFLKASGTSGTCGWKGNYNYYDVIVDGKIEGGAAWVYPEPLAAAKEIKGRVAFWKNVQLPSGERFSLEVEPTDSLVHIKRLIELKGHLPADRQRLLFAGRQLDSDELSLTDAGIAKETTIQVVLKRPVVPPKPPAWTPLHLSPDERARRQYLLMTVLEAADLKVGDLNGLSDPYCMIRIGSHNFRTRTISKTLNPVWNHSLRVETSGLETIHLEVWDEDTFSSDDFLGVVDIKLDLPLQENSWYRLGPREGKHDKHIRGSVRVQLLWEFDVVRRRQMEDAQRDWNDRWRAEAELQGLPH